jgi:hypothetical protein
VQMRVRRFEVRANKQKTSGQRSAAVCHSSRLLRLAGAAKTPGVLVLASGSVTWYADGDNVGSGIGSSTSIKAQRIHVGLSRAASCSFCITSDETPPWTFLAETDEMCQHWIDTLVASGARRDAAMDSDAYIRRHGGQVEAAIQQAFSRVLEAQPDEPLAMLIDELREHAHQSKDVGH